MLSIYKEILKRKTLDILKMGRLNTPMQNVMLALQAHHYSCKDLIALDIFGMHGLWNTKDFAPYCSYLEMWDIDPIYTHFAKKIIPSACVVTGNSIEVVNTGKLLKNKYNFIVSDNFVAGEYGGKYYEHFDFFENIFNYTDNTTIVIFNVVPNVEKVASTYQINKTKLDLWIEKRKLFYQESEVIYFPANKLIENYSEKILRKNYNVDFAFFVPRNELIGFVVLKISQK